MFVYFDIIISTTMEDVDMDKYVNEFLESLKADGKSKCTIDAYRLDLKGFYEYFNCVELDVIRYSDLREWVNNMENKGLSANTRARKISAVKSFFKYLSKMELVYRNPANGLETPKLEKKQPVVISNEDASEILFYAKNDGGSEMFYFRDYSIMAVFLFTGIRREELTNITLNDVDLKNGTILIHGKGNNQRTVYINETLYAILSEYIKVYRKRISKSKNSVFLFPSCCSEKVSVRTVNNIVNKFFEAAGIKQKGVSAHILRKRFATTLFQKTNDIALTSKMLGHSSPTVTMRYVIMDEDSMRNAANCVNF